MLSCSTRKGTGAAGGGGTRDLLRGTDWREGAVVPESLTSRYALPAHHPCADKGLYCEGFPTLPNPYFFSYYIHAYTAKDFTF